MEDYSLKKIFKSPFPARILPYLLLIFAFLGFFDAAYLTIVHYKHLIPPCTIHGCEVVLTSTYASLFGIPIALLGTGFYGIIIIFTGIYLTIRRKPHVIRQLLLTLCSLGFLTGLFLIFLQAFVIHAWCYYCLFSELIDFLLFDASWWLYASFIEKNY